MTFLESIKFCLGPGYMFKFKGRAPRSEFWQFTLFTVCVNLCLMALIAILPPLIGGTLGVAASLLLLPASLGVSVRRLHDCGFSGWWLLLQIGLALLAPTNMFGALLFLAASIGLLIIYCLPGQPYANKYGPITAASLKTCH